MAAKTSAKFTHSTVTTLDGAVLSYHSIGSGPGLIILHGAISYGLTHCELAILLSASYTVHLLSRRNRGLSGTYPQSITNMDAVLPLPAKVDETDSEFRIMIGGAFKTRTYREAFTSAVIETELSDINLIIEKTKSIFVLGVSVGAILLLAACLSPQAMPSFSNIRKIVIFEPPMQFSDLDTGLDVKGARRYEDEMASDDMAGALVTAMRLVQLGPSWIPRPIMKFISNLMIWSQRKTPDTADASGGASDEGNTSMLELAPILRYDFAVVEHMVGVLSRFEDVGNDRQILLLDGTNSPAYTKIITDRLETTIKGVQRVTIQGVGHEVLCNQDFRGKPAKAVGMLKQFFA